MKADRELCEELYRLSQWGLMSNGTATEYYYAKRWTSASKEYRLIAWNDVAESAAFLNMSVESGRIIPAYDVEYLLDKYAKHDVAVTLRYVGIGGSLSLDLEEWYGKFIACTPHLRQKNYPVADTPADVLCQLAIMLSKQGIFTEGGKS